MCNAEAASVEAATQRWAGKATFVGVATSGDEAQFQDFIDKYALSFPQISDGPGTIFDRFQIWSTPAAILIGPNGEVQQMGEANGDAIDSAIEQVLS